MLWQMRANVWLKIMALNAESKFVIRITKFRYLSILYPSIFYDPVEGI